MNKKAEFLIIGSGVAGLTLALKVADFGHVIIVTKKGVMESNSSQAQGGIASVFSEVDSFDLHIQDTMAAGDDLSNREVVEILASHFSVPRSRVKIVRGLKSRKKAVVIEMDTKG